jgi:hypothetical protein
MINMKASVLHNTNRLAKTMRVAVTGSLLLLFLLQCKASPPVKDVIKVMSYNVMKYGDGCQGPNGLLHGYLRTIVHYASPDVLGLVKVEAIPGAQSEKGKAPAGFADSILAGALNAAYPGRYAYCPYTNNARDNNQAILFYNKQKLAFASFVTLVTDITDFNLYKLYYPDPNLPKTHDTAFLYFVLLHTESGDDSKDRDRQVEEVMNALRKRFGSLSNIIVMGDFNLRKASEDGYQALVNNPEKQYRFFDPPFAVDKKVAYPANWEKHPERFAAFLTTSTRKKAKEPNDCGTGGGAKAWYDHILLSQPLTDRAGFYHYIPGSYRTIGNDGKRIDASVNDLPNSSAPTDVLNALYQMSNKYPVMLELGVSPRK